MELKVAWCLFIYLWGGPDVLLSFASVADDEPWPRRPSGGKGGAGGAAPGLDAAPAAKADTADGDTFRPAR